MRFLHVYGATTQPGCTIEVPTSKAASRPRSSGKGTGVGLPTVHGIMEQHHGFVTIDSAPGAGTMVDLHVPRMIDAAREAALAR